MEPATLQHPKPYEIVVGFDFSELSERALAEGIGMASRRLPAELHVVTVAEPAGTRGVRLPGDGEPVREELAQEIVRQRVAEIVKEYQAQHGAIGVERLAIYVLSGLPAGEPAKAITDLARVLDAQLIVVGTHGRAGVSRLLLGSVAAQVVREAPCSVQVVRPPDFVRGSKVPAVEPALREGEPHLRHFEHRRTYHYVDKVAPWTRRTMPVS
jgi:nucleotide-binding universal stress UspA family protein